MVKHAKPDIDPVATAQTGHSAYDATRIPPERSAIRHARRAPGRIAMGFRRPCRGRHVDDGQPAGEADAGAVRLHAVGRLDQAGDAVLGPPGTRLLGVVRVRRRAGDDQPSLRQRVPFGTLRRQPQLHAGRLHLGSPGTRAEMPGDGARPARHHQRRHAADERGARRQAWRRLHPRAAGRRKLDREILRRRRRHPLALRRGHALPWWPHRAVPLPPLPGRAAGVRTGPERGLLRRRSGQFQFPALRPRRDVPACVRQRPSGAHAVLPVRPRRPEGWTAGVHLRQSGLDLARGTGGPAAAAA